MKDSHPSSIKLTSSELSVLWGTYINDALAISTISYFLAHVEDPKVRSVLTYTMKLATNHVQKITALFEKERIAIPVGFTEKDVHTEASRLYSDAFILYYIQNMGSMGLSSYSMALPHSARPDVRTFFTSCLETSAELYNRASTLLQEKELFVRSPSIPYPEQVDFVHKKSFFAGWMGEQRPFTTVEISFLFFNMYRNTIGQSLLMGFSQVASNKEVREYMIRGVEVAKHHSGIFSGYLREGDLLSPMSWDMQPTTSTESPFSDKLMMFHATAMMAAGIGYYGASMGSSARRDLSVTYARLIIETGELSKDGADILIKNGWLEQPISAPDRKKLAGDHK